MRTSYCTIHSSAFLELIASRDEIVIAQVTHDTAAAAVGPHTASAVLIGNTSTGLDPRGTLALVPEYVI